jgi:hypothetical protein
MLEETELEKLGDRQTHRVSSSDVFAVYLAEMVVGLGEECQGGDCCRVT